MDVILTALNDTLSAYAINLTLAAAAGALVLLLLARRRPAPATLSQLRGSHVAAHRRSG